jgi:hypothetical protein
MTLEITTEEGSHEVIGEHVYKGVTYEVELFITNTESEADRCELGYDMPHTIETTTDIELLEAMANDEPVTDINLLKELEADLYYH